jgi:hypothetical protein
MNQVKKSSRLKSRKMALDPSEQLKRFKDMARELGADESPGALDRAFGRLNPKQRAIKPKAKR